MVYGIARICLVPSVMIASLACVAPGARPGVPVDTAELATSFDIDVEVPGWSSWSGTPLGARAVHLDGPSCVASDVLTFAMENESMGLNADLVLGPNGSTMATAGTSWFPVQIGTDDVTAYHVYDGVLVAERDGRAWVVELHEGSTCRADAPTVCEPLGGPITIRFDGPIARMDDDIVPHASVAWLDPVSGAGLCVEPGLP